MDLNIIDVSNEQDWQHGKYKQVLKKYSQIPIHYQVKEILEIVPVDNGLKGFSFNRKSVEPFVKHYDTDEKPESWADNWDLKNWKVLQVIDGNNHIGGAIIAIDTLGVNMLRDRSDLAVLWDIRIHPEYRGKGIGSKLVSEVIEICRLQNCVELIVETQNINVPACNFYVRMGFKLSKVDCLAYPDLSDEVQLIWHMRI